MQTVEGYFNGVNVELLEDVKLKPNQRVLVTFMDNVIRLDPPVKNDNWDDIVGIFSRKANPELIPLEKEAWANAAAEKYRRNA